MRKPDRGPGNGKGYPDHRWFHVAVLPRTPGFRRPRIRTHRVHRRAEIPEWFIGSDAHDGTGTTKTGPRSRPVCSPRAFGLKLETSGDGTRRSADRGCGAVRTSDRTDAGIQYCGLARATGAETEHYLDGTHKETWVNPSLPNQKEPLTKEKPDV